MKSNIISINVENLYTKALRNMMNNLDYETKFMLIEPGERIKSLL